MFCWVHENWVSLFYLQTWFIKELVRNKQSVFLWIAMQCKCPCLLLISSMNLSVTYCLPVNQPANISAVVFFSNCHKTKCYCFHSNHHGIEQFLFIGTRSNISQIGMRSNISHCFLLKLVWNINCTCVSLNIAIIYNSVLVFISSFDKIHFC